VDLGQTGRSIEARCKDHLRHVSPEEPEKSAVAENSINTGHRMDFSGTSVSDKRERYMDCLVKEAIEIRLNFSNFNRDGGFTLSWAWYPVINMAVARQSKQLTPPASPSLVASVQPRTESGQVYV
jgi:hypothetical protein